MEGGYAIVMEGITKIMHGVQRIEKKKMGKILEMPVMVLCLIVFTLVSPCAHAGDVSSGKSKWEIHVIPYFWMAGINGDSTIKGIDSKVDATFGDIWNNLDFAGQFYMEARKDKWGLFLDPTYLKLSSDAHVDRPIIGRINADLTFKEWLVEFGGFYQLATWPPETSEKGALSVDALGGGRYWNVDMELNLDVPLVGLGRRFEESEDWIDPFVGLRLRADLTKKLSLVLRGDVGGFGVSSDFTWSASGLLGYSFSDLISVWAGYRGLGVDYESGSGSSRFNYNVTMHGPIVGLGFHF